ncbi:nuclear transport factor 2 family protein [Lactobacillus sp. ESL0731]|uniref:nuclear transport factor 2 family protein n=1 Tax=unclassified Lactobacillus TaxID=2620435 RepID=UPI0023F8070F|nr:MULTISPECIES: nuclear transport factor 2 family protein [unclassified Lactobacillus]WEV51561.1 nuclear transport factor 2 family protein [Lactobacillus sp. ESL0700]WEV62689.1 nuclear transport factor 2 family protein [Lactobacillus sp. ESL0731]
MTEADLQRTKIIKDYFASWVKRDFTQVPEWFSPEIFYRECYGATYQGLHELIVWLAASLPKQTVLEWRIDDIEITNKNKFVVTWFFHAKDEKEYAFDGVSLIEFKGNKIIKVSEYSAKHELTRPYKNH